MVSTYSYNMKIMTRLQDNVGYTWSRHASHETQQDALLAL